jgi:hypothetical protein
MAKWEDVPTVLFHYLPEAGEFDYIVPALQAKIDRKRAELGDEAEELSDFDVLEEYVDSLGEVPLVFCVTTSGIACGPISESVCVGLDFAASYRDIVTEWMGLPRCAQQRGRRGGVNSGSAPADSAGRSYPQLRPILTRSSGICGWPCYLIGLANYEKAPNDNARNVVLRMGHLPSRACRVQRGDRLPDLPWPPRSALPARG